MAGGGPAPSSADRLGSEELRGSRESAEPGDTAGDVSAPPSPSESGDEAYDSRDVIGNRKSSESASPACRHRAHSTSVSGQLHAVDVNTQCGVNRSTAATGTPQEMDGSHMDTGTHTASDLKP